METREEKISRLQREITERQAELQRLVLGDPSAGVGMTVYGGCVGPIYHYASDSSSS